MTERPEHIERLTSVPTELQAGLIMAALKENGINAHTFGEATAGFRAAVPNWVEVLVAEDDLERAKQVLARVQQENDHLDWSQVDVGEPEEE